MLKLLEPGSDKYTLAFHTLLRCLEGEEVHFRTVLRSISGSLPRRARAVDWGAGSGRKTRELCELFDTVYAVEPSPAMREELVKVAPSAIVLDTTIAAARLPEPVDLGIISHVHYHIPDYEWGGVTLRCASQLTERGVLLVSLKHPDTPCNRMLEDFGAPRFNLFSLAEAFRRSPEYTLKFQSAPGKITTSSFEDTVSIAHFMLSDRTADSFPRWPSREEFEEYVGRNFWDANRSVGGWDFLQVFAIIERNPFM